MQPPIHPRRGQQYELGPECEVRSLTRELQMTLTSTTKVPPQNIFPPPANTTCEHKNQNMTTYKYNFAKHTQHAQKSTHARTEG